MAKFKYKSKTIPWDVEIETEEYKGKEYIRYCEIRHRISGSSNRMPDRIAKIMLELIQRTSPIKLK